MRALRRLAILGLALFSSLLAVAGDNSLTPAQYIETLNQLRSAVRDASDSKALSDIADQLPERWTVVSGTQRFDVPTATLQRSLEQYAGSRNSTNLAALLSVIDLLATNARQLKGGEFNAAAERQKYSEILSRKEFSKVAGESWLERWKASVRRWIAERLGRMLTSSAFPVVSKAIVWVMLLLAGCIVLLWIVRSYRAGNIYSKFEASPGVISAIPWRDWQAEAQSAARQGRWRDAVHLSYWAAISYLEAQGLWRPDRARTPREYLRLLAAEDSHREALQELTHRFEQIWYGNEIATSSSYAGTSVLLERLGCR